MGINTQKFLMLFLVLPRSCALTLEFAARVIHGKTDHPLKGLCIAKMIIYIFLAHARKKLNATNLSTV